MKYSKERPTEAGQYWFRQDHISRKYTDWRGPIVVKVVRFDHAPGRLFAFHDREYRDVNEMGGEFAGPLPEPEG